MKISKLALFIIVISAAGQLFSQSNEDIIIIDDIADDITELLATYANHPRVYVTDSDTPEELRQLSDQLVDLRIEDLHIYTPTKPGAIVFSAMVLSPGNLDILPFDLTDWTTVISGKVIIHSDLVFTGDQGQLLKEELESRTGLEFISQN